MHRPRQLVLDFDHRPALSAENFLVADSNRDAAAWLDLWPRWPAPALVLHGPAGSGKTHLVHVFLARTQGRLVAAADLGEGDPAELCAGAAAVVVDDADRIAGGPCEEPLLHLYNRAAESRRHLLLTGREAPLRWPIGLADLRSRLLAAPSVAIGAPDDGLIRALLVKQFADRRLAADETVITYLVARMERSFAAARDLVERIDREAAESKRRVGIALVRRVLEEDREPPGG
jgi:chromosomal replication initiation ATPase DnaA